MENELHWSKSLNLRAYVSSSVKWDLTKWPLSKVFGSNANSKISCIWKSEMHKSKSVIFAWGKPTQGKNFLAVYFLLPDPRWLSFYMTLEREFLSVTLVNSKHNRNLCVPPCLPRELFIFACLTIIIWLSFKTKVTYPLPTTVLLKNYLFLQLYLQSSRNFLKSGFIASKQNVENSSI